MTVESASYISQLDTTLPTAADLISEGDDHLRLTKTVLKTQFPNFGTTAISASAAEVNYSVGVTSSIQTQLNSKAPTVSPTFTGTAALPATTSIGTVSDVEIATLDGVTSSIQAQIDSKGAIAGQAWTGAHSFAGATSVPTLAAGSNTTGAASTAFVQADFLQKFPNYTAPVNASTAELNYLVGLTGAIQPQLSNQVSGPIHAATTKTTPADADELGITDSATSWGLKKLTFANLKAWIGGLFVGKTGAQSMTGVLTAGGLLSNAGGIGYGVGAGGTVTQTTSKNTSVTLNKPSGYITTVAGSIAANSIAPFPVFNSTVGDGDTVTVTLVGGVANGASYMIDAQAISVGAFYIIVRNITGAATPAGDAPTIQFNVHKGARS